MAYEDETSTSAQFAQLLEVIQANQVRTDERLEQFRAELQHGQEEAACKALKRVRVEKPFSFRRKGNEEQAVFNDRVEEAISDTQAELATVRSMPAIEKMREALKKGAQLLAERQKLTKIADRSEFGWVVVTEYTADKLADDSNNEKHLEKAEKAAERKAAKRSKKKPPTGLARPMGPCFACGEMGHIRSFCPKISLMEGKKWYPQHGGCCGSVGGAGEHCGVPGECCGVLWWAN